MDISVPHKESDQSVYKSSEDEQRPTSTMNDTSSQLKEEKQQTGHSDINVNKVHVSQQTKSDVLREFGTVQNALYSFKDSGYWINAYEEAEKQAHVPEAAVKVCLYIFHDAFRFCEERLSLKREAMLGAVSEVLQVPKFQASIAVNTPILISEYIQMHADLPIEHLRKDFLSSGLPRIFEAHKISAQNIGPDLQAYAMKAVELAWFAVIGDTPLELEITKRGSPFDEAKYSPYTRTSKVLDYVVWPVIKYKDGKILYKGVAEGRQT